MIIPPRAFVNQKMIDPQPDLFGITQVAVKYVFLPVIARASRGFACHGARWQPAGARKRSASEPR